MGRNELSAQVCYFTKSLQIFIIQIYSQNNQLQHVNTGMAKKEAYESWNGI